jgi:Fe-S-cluster containining protein
MNKTLRAPERKAAIERAIGVIKRVEELRRRVEQEGGQSDSGEKRLHILYAEEKIKCPLNLEAKCILYDARPIVCRMHGLTDSPGSEAEILGDLAKRSKRSKPEADLDRIHRLLQRLSRNVLHALTSVLSNDNGPTFTLPSTVAGRFVQEYFHWITTANI